jgi:ribosomal protein S10
MTITYNFKLKSFDSNFINKAINSLVLNFKTYNCISVKGPISLPVEYKRFTVLRSPHVNKLSREQFELRTYTKMVEVTIDNKNVRIGELLEKYESSNLPTGLSLRVIKKKCMLRTTRTSNL